MSAPALADYRHAARTRRILLGLVPLLCPPEAAALGLADAIVDHVELSMRAMPAAVRAALVAGLAAYDLAAVARHGRRAHRLDRARGQRHLDRWQHGYALQHELIQGIKSLLCLAHYEQPAVQALLGYQPDAWLDQVARRRLALHHETIARHQASLIAPDPLPATAAGQAAQAAPPAQPDPHSSLHPWGPEAKP